MLEYKVYVLIVSISISVSQLKLRLCFFPLNYYTQSWCLLPLCASEHRNWEGEKSVGSDVVLFVFILFVLAGDLGHANGFFFDSCSVGLRG